MFCDWGTTIQAEFFAGSGEKISTVASLIEARNLLPSSIGQWTRCYFRGVLDTLLERPHLFSLRFSPEPLLCWRGRNFRHATGNFISARRTVPDQAPVGPDRRDCGRQPGRGGRLSKPPIPIE
jgi:hypothetical protein